MAQTLNDVLDRTRELHSGLAASLGRAASATDDPRAQLLMDFLSEHEEKLEQAVDSIQKNADAKQLDTWFYDFTQKHNVVRTGGDHKTYSKMTTDEIMGEVMEEHDQIIQFYRYLYGRAGTSPAHELLRELLELEQHEAMQLSQEGNRANDM